MSTEADRAAVEAYLEEQFARHPDLVDRVSRQILLELHRRGLVSVETIYRRAGDDHREEPDPNRPHFHPWSEETRRRLAALAKEYGAAHLSRDEVEDFFQLARKRSQARELVDLATMQGIPSDFLARRVLEFARLPEKGPAVPREEALGTRVALLRHFITENLQVLGVAKRFLRIRDLPEILRRVVGTPRGIGKIGGKATGIYLARAILCGRLRVRPEFPPPKVKIPASYHLRTDVFNDLLARNGLMGYYDHKYDPPERIREDYGFIQQMLLGAQWAPAVERRLARILAQLGEHPLVVRSSSLLEDSFDATFSGKYASVFLPNQGPLGKRLAELKAAVAEVYASTFAPDPIEYRKRKNLLDYDERMAVIIQKAVGRRHGRYFFPLYAGIAFSRNEFRWSKRIRREDGFARLVLGLGTRAVDRVGGDYPRMVALSDPTLRPQIHPETIRRYSQRYVDVIDLADGGFRHVPLRQLLREVRPAGLERIVSVYEDGHLMPPVGRVLGKPPERLVVTFDRLLAEGRFTALLKDVLKRLEEGYGVPVDVEFACDGEDFYLLQCRPFTGRADGGRVELPREVPAERILFAAVRDVTSGRVRRIEYVVYVDPHVYDRLGGRNERTRVARLVGRVNERLTGRSFILLGPGRWGTNDPQLGVPVSYADICNTRVLVEVAFEKEGYVPEVSFGTHFFQDLVEAGIHYLPLYPDDPGVTFRERFFSESPSILTELVRAEAPYTACVRVVHVPAVTGGYFLELAMDGESERAVGWLERG